MFKFILSAFFVTFLSLFSLPQLAKQQPDPPLKIETIADLPILLWYQKYIIKAYAELGYRLSFIEIQPGRGIEEAKKGNFDALLIRLSMIEKQIPEYIRVPVLLSDGHLVLYCQQDLPCDKSVLNDPEKVIGVVAGVNMTSNFMKGKLANLYQVVNGKKLAQMFMKARLDYILSIDGTNFGNYVAIPKEQFNSVALLEMNAFHYVHRRHADLVPEIAIALQQAMELIGPIPEDFAR